MYSGISNIEIWSRLTFESVSETLVHCNVWVFPTYVSCNLSYRSLEWNSLEEPLESKSIYDGLHKYSLTSSWVGSKLVYWLNFTLVICCIWWYIFYSENYHRRTSRIIYKAGHLKGIEDTGHITPKIWYRFGWRVIKFLLPVKHFGKARKRIVGRFKI